MINLYETQKKFINDAKKVIENEEIGIFSSPTGTGKTISLLLSVMDYLCDDDDINITNENRLLEQLLFNKSNKTQVIYSSKTHIQLQQSIKELKMLDTKCNSVILGSRKIYCVNKSVNKLNNNDAIDDMCRNLIKTEKCEYYNNKSTFNKTGIIDIEDLLKDGNQKKYCPYYASKDYSKLCQIVFLPYQLVFTKEGRKSADIAIKDTILIVDEAHNIYNSVIEMNTASVALQVLKKYILALDLYKNKYGSRLKNYEPLDNLLEILKRLSSFLKDQNECVMGVTEFLISSKIENFNMLEIEDYIIEKNLINKLEGFGRDLNMQMFGISKFLSLLIMSDSKARIFVEKDRVKFVPLDPSMYFEPMMDCSSILLAGGTMEPIEDIKSVFSDRVCRYFSYDSVCKTFLPFIVGTAPSGREIILNYENRGNENIIKDVIMTIRNLSNTVKNGGMVVFFPSKQVLELFKDKVGESMGVKKVMCEGEITFQVYSNFKAPKILFAVMGGKLSEGVNFGDDLCRMLIVVGVPYPNKSSETEERVKIIGKEYQTIVAMKTVNQTLGRAIRHKNDYAVLVLLDQRYSKLIKYISPWIRSQTKVVDFRGVFNESSEFFKSRQF